MRLLIDGELVTALTALTDKLPPPLSVMFTVAANGLGIKPGTELVLTAAVTGYQPTSFIVASVTDLPDGTVHITADESA